MARLPPSKYGKHEVSRAFPSTTVFNVAFDLSDCHLSVRLRQSLSSA